MCGIISILAKNPDIAEQSAAQVATHLPTMLATLGLRGPDMSTHQRHGDAWLGHTRLSIIDVDGGAQPIFNEDGTVGIVFNGEIYNFKELRRTLEARGHIFSTNSDSETIVHLYEEYGEGLFAHLNGMFGVSVYDVRRKILLVGRDCLGEKPIIYRETDEHIFVASELKALLKWPDTPREMDPEALALYLNFLCVPAPATIFKGIRKLPPAHYLKHENGRTTIAPYWQPAQRIDWAMSEDRAVEELNTLLARSVTDRMVADVPLGIFLSGGIDSSAVTALAAENSATPISTFCVGFADGFDERPFARLVAERHGTDHHEINLSTTVADAFPLVMDYFDEPFADSSSLPTYMVSRAAREFVTVVLTGDGGDELFAGYDSYVDQKYLRGGRLKSRANRLVNETLTGMGQHRIADALYARTSGSWQQKHWHYLRSTVRPNALSQWLGPDHPDVADFFRRNVWLDVPDRDPLSVAFSFDLNYFLPDDLLKKVDMAAMLTSLECRAPFLDPALVEFSLRVPPTLKLRGDSLKNVLKKSMRDHLPPAIIERPKMGFGAPILNWINGPLHELSHDLIRPGCRAEQYFAPEMVRACAGKAFAGDESDFRTPLQFWTILVLEWWLRKYM